MLYRSVVLYFSENRSMKDSIDKDCLLEQAWELRLIDDIMVQEAHALIHNFNSLNCVRLLHASLFHYHHHRTLSSRP